MTTKLNQRRVKSTDPAYPSLEQQLESRLRAEGEGYIMPVGGIPRGDMTDDVQEALSLAEGSYTIPLDGVPLEDLNAAVQASLMKADSAFQLPDGGLTSEYFEPVIKSRLENYADLYLYPATGLPYVDMDANVKELLDKADSAYQKPAAGIPKTDLDSGVTVSLGRADSAYQKPAAGIPLTDMEVPVTTDADHEALVTQFTDHVNDHQIHARDHKLMENIGTYTHEDIDHKLDTHDQSITSMGREILKARGTYDSLDNRIASSLFAINDLVMTGSIFMDGVLMNLNLTDDGFLSLQYTPEQIPMDFYDTDLSKYLRTTPVDSLDFTWPNSPTSGVIGQNAYVNITGYFYAQRTGTYRFNIQASGDFTMTLGTTTATAVYQNQTSIYSDEEAGYYLDVPMKGGQFYPMQIAGRFRRNANNYFRILSKLPNDNTFAVVDKTVFTTTGFNAAPQGTFVSKTLDTLDLKIVDWTFKAELDLIDYRSLVVLEYRSGDIDSNFGEWQPIFVDQIFVEMPKRYMQFRVTLGRNSNFISPCIQSVTFHYTSSRNAILDEILNARGEYNSLPERITASEAMASQAVTLVQDAEVINPAWLADARFEHIDLNMLRMQLQMSKTMTSVSGTPGMISMWNGFVQDFVKDDWFNTALSDPYVIDGSSYVRAASVQTTWDVDADWLQWTRSNMGPDTGSLRLTLVGGGAASTLNATVADLLQYTTGTIVQHSTPQTFYQPFFLNPDDLRLNSIQFYAAGGTYEYDYQYVYQWTNGIPQYAWTTAGPYSWGLTTLVYLVASRAVDGEPDTTREILLGTAYATNVGGYQVTMNPDADTIVGMDGWRLTPGGKIKFFLKLVCNDVSTSYSTGGGINQVNWRYKAGMRPIVQSVVASQNTWVTALNGDNTKADKLFARNGSQGVITNTYYPIKVNMYKAVSTQGESSIVKDYGKRVKFLSVDATILLRDGVLQMYYQSSDDGVTFSPMKRDIKNVPNGRYLKITVQMGRVLTNQSPDLQKLVINWQPETTIWIGGAVPLSKIPTHLVFDAKDTGNGAFSYYASRDGGANFVQVTPGQQTDLRTIPAGTSLVIKTVGNPSNPVDAGVDYILAQAVVHDNYQKATIVSQHEEYIATAGQKVFNLVKAYYMGDRSLQVYKNGSLLSYGNDYQETSNTVVTFVNALTGGERITFRVAAAAYQFGNAEVLGQHIDEVATAVLAFGEQVDDVIEHLTQVDTTQGSINARLDLHEAALAGIDNRDADMQNQIDQNKADATAAIAISDAKASAAQTRMNLYDPLIVGTKQIDETDLSNGRMIVYDQTSGKLRFVDPPNTLPGGLPTGQQSNQLGVVGSAGSPKKVSLTIPLTLDFNRPPVEVLSFNQVNGGTIVSQINFNAGDSTLFQADTSLSFNGTLSLQTAFSLPSTAILTSGIFKVVSATVQRSTMTTIERMDLV